MDSAYMDRFGGVARLLGVRALERLFQSHVAVVGIGGVGSWVVEALARSGVGNLTLIDLDDVCITNTNRQLPALETTLGRPKVDVLADRVRQINPACQVHGLGEFFTAQSAERLMAGRFDCVVDAIDHLGNKCLLIDSARRRGCPVVTIGGAGGKKDAGRIERGDLGMRSAMNCSVRCASACAAIMASRPGRRKETLSSGFDACGPLSSASTREGTARADLSPGAARASAWIAPMDSVRESG
jgi:tRNA A37 threonylcarbamoyladenosine dehydratase